MPSNVFDLNSAFVYYVNQVDARTKGKNFTNFLDVLNTDQVQLIVTGDPTYNPALSLQSLQGSHQSLATSSFRNSTTVQDTATFNQSETHTAAFSVAVTEGIKLGAQTKVTAGIPFIVGSEINLSAEATLSSTQTTSSTESQTFSINTQINVPPNSRIDASLVIDALQYAGTLTNNVRVAGSLRVTPPKGQGNAFSVTMAQLFIALKAVKGNISFSKTDSAGNSFSFTTADLNRFTVTTPPNQVSYQATSNITANFGASQSVQIKQYDLKSGQMVSQSTL